MDTARRLGVADRIDLMGQRSGRIVAVCQRWISGSCLRTKRVFQMHCWKNWPRVYRLSQPMLVATRKPWKGMPDCVLVKPEDAEDLSRGLASLISTDLPRRLPVARRGNGLFGSGTPG